MEYLLTWHGRARDSPPVSTPRQTKEKEEKVPFTLPPANVDQPQGVCLSPQAWDRTPSDPGLCGGWIAVTRTPNITTVSLLAGTNQERRYLPINEEPMIGTAAALRGMSQAAIRDIAFRLYCSKKHDAVLVFEAPIDLMSFCTLHRKVTSNAVALCGLYEGGLRTYLRDNPHIRRIILCLDNDEHGRQATQKLREMFSAEDYEVSQQLPPQERIGMSICCNEMCSGKGGDNFQKKK